MSITLTFIGKFNNGKKRIIGSHVKTNGINNSKLYLNDEDTMFIVRMLESENKCFNWCLENNKFKEVKVCAYYEGKEIIKEKINLPLKRISKEIVINYIEKANAEAKKEVEKKYNRLFNELTIVEKEKTFNHWDIMQPINKKQEELMIEFNSLININSRVDKYYNIIFNA